MLKEVRRKWNITTKNREGDERDMSKSGDVWKLPGYTWMRLLNCRYLIIIYFALIIVLFKFRMNM